MTEEKPKETSLKTADYLLLRNWLYKSSHYEKMHQQSYYYYYIIDRVINIPLICLTGGGTLTSFSGLYSDHSSAITIAVSIILAISTALTAIYAWLKPGEISENHRKTANIFHNIVDDIEMGLVMNKNTDGFVFDIKARMKKAVEDSPAIPKHIYSDLPDDLLDLEKQPNRLKMKLDASIKGSKANLIRFPSLKIEQEQKFKKELEQDERLSKRPESPSPPNGDAGGKPIEVQNV